MDNKPEIRVMSNGNICVEVPLAIRRRHGRKMIIAPETIAGGNPCAETPAQSPIAQSLARAHAWMDAIESGGAIHVRHLAEKLNLDCSYVGKILRLANLAPDIQEAIIRGNEPDGLSLTQLRRPLPLNWAEQRQILQTKRQSLSAEKG